MEKLRRDHGWEKGLLTALFLLACFQNLTLASIGSPAVHPEAALPHH